MEQKRERHTKCLHMALDEILKRQYNIDPDTIMEKLFKRFEDFYTRAAEKQYTTEASFLGKTRNRNHRGWLDSMN